MNFDHSIIEIINENITSFLLLSEFIYKSSDTNKSFWVLEFFSEHIHRTGSTINLRNFPFIFSNDAANSIFVFLF